MGGTVKRCDEIPRLELVERLSGLMFLAGVDVRMKSHIVERQRIPGFCVICGQKLPITYRATKFDGGETRSFEADHSPEALARVTEFKNKYPRDEVGLRNGYLLMEITQCEAINEAAWNEASKLLKTKARETRSAPAKARQASEERRQKAARRLSGE
jgi:hypothetical protein